MRIKELNIIDFGKFHKPTPFDGINQDLVLFYGHNEAGKTTIFHLIKNLFYGFSPAKIEQHPYASWQRERIEFSAVLETEGDGEVQVYRRLMSAPKGEMTIGTQVKELRNQPVPYAKHISMEIYNRIYSLRVEDLIELQGKAWEEVQDKLLANYGSHQIKGTKAVLKGISEEANQLYRISGKGNFRIKDLENEIKVLKKERIDAIRRQEELRNNEVQLEGLREETIKLTEEKTQLKTLLKRAARTTPLKRVLQELEMVEQAFHNKGVFMTLPENAVQRLTEEGEKLKALLMAVHRKEETAAGLEEKLYSFTPQEEKIISLRNEIENYYKLAIKLEGLKAELQQLESELLRIKDRQRHEARNLLSGELSEEVIERIGNLSIPELRILVGNYQKTKHQLQELEKIQIHQRQLQSSMRSTKGYVGAGLMAMAFLILGILSQNWILYIAAGLSSIYALTDLLANRKNKKKSQRELKKQTGFESLEDEISRLKEKAATEKQQIVTAFNGISIADVVLENIEEVFLTNLVRLKDYLFEIKEKEFLLHQKKTDFNRELIKLRDFIKEIDPFSESQAEDKIHELRRRCEELVSLSLNNRNVKEMLMENRNDQKVLGEEIPSLQESIEALKTGILALGNGDLERGKDHFIENHKLLLRKGLLDEKLREYVDLSSLLGELRELEEEAPWVFETEALERIEVKLEAIEEVLQGMKEQEKVFALRSASLLEKITLDEIESSLLALELEIESLSFKRDRLILLGEVIRRADERFREENQPDVLKNASHYLNIMTKGRYTHIYLEEEEEETFIRLRERGAISPKRIGESFSKGTLNQLFLALRLSLIDHLDQQGEALPICFDELLINFDGERLNQYLQLLKEICKKRQVFMFTCHDWFAERLEMEFNIKRIQLEADGIS